MYDNIDVMVKKSKRDNHVCKLWMRMAAVVNNRPREFDNLWSKFNAVILRKFGAPKS